MLTAEDSEMLSVRESRGEDESQHSVTQPERSGIKPIIRQDASPDLTYAAVLRSGNGDKFLLELFLEGLGLGRNQPRVPTASP